MLGFIAKQLSREKKLGDKLRSLREEHRIKVSALSAALHIPERYLLDLESGRYETLPEEIYVKNFIRAYARTFGRDSSPYLDLYELEARNVRKKRPKEHLVPNVGIKKSHLLPTVFIVRGVVAGLITLSLLIYLGFEVKKITSPPQLTVIEPKEGMVTRTGEIIVQGQSEPESRIQINGEDVLADSSGAFKEVVRLQRGLNIISISAAKRRSKERILWRRVLYEEPVALR